MRIIVRAEIEELPPKEQIFIYYRFYEQKNLNEIKKITGWRRGLVWSVRCEAYDLLRKSEAMQALRKVYQFHDNSSPESMIVSFGDSGLEIL